MKIRTTEMQRFEKFDCQFCDYDKAHFYITLCIVYFFCVQERKPANLPKRWCYNRRRRTPMPLCCRLSVRLWHFAVSFYGYYLH